VGGELLFCQLAQSVNSIFTSFVNVLGHGGYTLIRATFPEAKMAKSPYGVVFNRSAAIVGIAKDHPLSLSESLRRRIERLGDEYGYWYEARIGTIEISWVKKFKGAWDKGVEKPEQFLSEQSHGVYFSDPRHLLGVSRLSSGTRMIGGGRILRHPIGESDA